LKLTVGTVRKPIASVPATCARRNAAQEGCSEGIECGEGTLGVRGLAKISMSPVAFMMFDQADGSGELAAALASRAALRPSASLGMTQDITPFAALQPSPHSCAYRH